MMLLLIHDHLLRFSDLLRLLLLGCYGLLCLLLGCRWGRLGRLGRLGGWEVVEGVSLVVDLLCLFLWWRRGMGRLLSS